MFSFIAIASIAKCMSVFLTETSSSGGAQESGEKKCMKNAGSLYKFLNEDLFFFCLFFALLIHYFVMFVPGVTLLCLL